VARFAPSLFGARSGAVYVLNATRSIAGSGVVWGEIAAAEQHFAAPDCWAMRRNKIHPEDTAQAEIGCPHMRSDNARRHACAPLTANGELLGVLHLRERPLPMDSHERAFFAMTAERIALAVANLRLRENLARQSVRDPLTGLFNRRYLEEFLALEERRVLRSGRSIGIVMIDLDRFKDVNERHGRQTGDDVLRRIATTLQEHTRAGDIVCRYGGEEFLLALPGASLEITMLRADHLRTLLTTDAFLVGDAMVGPLTVSIGVAAFPESGTSIADALAASDRAVYAAKQKGRNRVECEQWKAVA
jgi:diguanylate cyclase (GGDEF)-like protein